jgi:hypothetical protein
MRAKKPLRALPYENRGGILRRIAWKSLSLSSINFLRESTYNGTDKSLPQLYLESSTSRISKPESQVYRASCGNDGEKPLGMTQFVTNDNKLSTNVGQN